MPPFVDDIALWLRIGILCIYGVTALLDVRYRAAPNGAWLGILALAVFALSSEGVSLSRLAAIALVTMGAAAVAMHAFDRGWIGGADAKAVMVLPVAFPFIPARPMVAGGLGALIQGFEAVLFVSAVAGMVGLVLQQVAQRSEGDRGVPFLVAIFAGVVALFAI